MATSGTYTYSIQRDTLIQATFRLMGVFNDDAPPPSSDINNAAQALNLMIKDWMSRGYPLWTVTDVTLPLVVGQTQYLCGPGNVSTPFRPLRLTYARLHYTTSGLEVPLIQLSRQEYDMLGNKTNAGTPNSYYYDPQTTNGILSLYLPVDSSNQPNTVIITCQRPIQDMTSFDNDFDFPIEWLNAIKYGLAAELSLEYDIPPQKSQMLIGRAEKHLNDMLDWSQEEASTFFTPDSRYTHKYASR
jgi:hypothetical protein